MKVRLVCTDSESGESATTDLDVGYFGPKSLMRSIDAQNVADTGIPDLPKCKLLGWHKHGRVAVLSFFDPQGDYKYGCLVTGLVYDMR